MLPSLKAIASLGLDGLQGSVHLIFVSAMVTTTDATVNSAKPVQLVVFTYSPHVELAPAIPAYRLLMHWALFHEDVVVHHHFTSFHCSH